MAKIIIISEVLDEPFEMDSETFEYSPYTTDRPFKFSITVKEKLEALLHAEEMRKPKVRDRHSIFRRRGNDS